MQRETQPAGIDIPSPTLQRTQSNSTGDRDRTPSISGSSLAPPPHLTPDPAYIAPSAASQIVSSELVPRPEGWAPLEDIDEDNATIVLPAALMLVNAFLDQLLFSFLASSRSTSILALRPSISEILKPRLAKEAIDGADEELQGYMAGGDDEEFLDFHSGQELKGGSNVRQIFRRTRLRCMVYTRLGDMEEEDEDSYLEEDQPIEMNDEQHRLSRDLGSVSPAAAIFLTSIIEFIGEQALIVAGEAAYVRIEKKKVDPKETRPVVEEGDVEKLAFDKTLGRLWRSWKKKVRISSMLTPVAYKHSVSASEKASRTTSVSAEDDATYFDEHTQRRPSVAEILQKDRGLGYGIPPRATDLPEEPDFGSDSDPVEVPITDRERPRSMIEYRKQFAASPEPPQETAEQNGSGSIIPEERPGRSRQRYSSLPARQTPYVSPINETFTTPSEGPDPFTGNPSEPANAEKALPQLTDDSKTVPKLAGGHPAVSTMYDGLLVRDTARFPADPTLSSRGVSMSEYSEQEHMEHDRESTPQALNFKKALPSAGEELTGNEESRPSTLSSNYSFQAGQMSPLAPPEDLSQEPSNKDSRLDSSFPTRADSLHEKPSAGTFASLAAMQGDRLRTYDESGKAVKRDIPVLYEAPSNQDVIYNPEASSKNLKDEGNVSTPTRAQPTAVEGGVPNLTSLRDLMDAAHDTSDENSSLAPSYDASQNDAFLTGQGPGHQKSESKSSINGNQRQPLATTGRLLDQRKEPLTVNAGLERAAVQRMSPPSATSREPLQSFEGRTSASSNRDGPPTTGLSSSPKVRSMMGRESNDLVRQTTVRSNATDGSEHSTSGPLKAVKSTDKQQDFEQLIRSDETIQYTLTPQNMREMEKTDSPRWSAQPAETPSPEMASSRPGLASEGDRPSTRSIKTLRGNLNGLRSNPTNTANVMEFATGPQLPPKSPGGRKGVVAREAAAKEDSVRGFADFIRSTGPDTDPKVMAKSMSGANQAHSRGGSATSQQGLGTKAAPKKITKPSPVVAPKKSESNLPTRSSSKLGGTSKLKAREATVATSNTTADLADFLRGGPDGMDGGRPSQRTAPSPQTNATNGLSGGRLQGGIGSGTSIASTQDSSAPSKMTHSSTNSRTALIDGGNRGPARANSQCPTRNDDPPSGGPVRKQRRARDPYAIDFTDEEDDFSTPQQTEREEESLSDFLRNYNPPPTTTTKPAVATSPPSGDQNQKPRKGSGVSLRERVTRNIAVIPDYRPLPPKAPKKNTSKSPPVSNEKTQQKGRQTPNQNASPPPNSRRDRGALSNAGATNNATAPQLPPLNPRSTSPHLISQNGSKMDTWKPTHPTYAAHRDRRPKPQARNEQGTITGDTGGGRGGMTDLAAFLRETEPPAPSGPIGGGMEAPSPRSEGKGGWFGRRRKGVP